MMKRLIVLVGVAGVFCAPAALAQDVTPDLYITGGAGLVSTDDFGDGQLYTFGAGVALPLGLRGDVTGVYQTGLAIEMDIPEIPEIDFDVWSGFVSGYYDLPEPVPFLEPYVGGGVGVSQVEVDGGDSSSDTSYHVSAGVSFVVMKKVALDVGYRYVDYGDLENDEEFTANQFMITGRLAL